METCKHCDKEFDTYRQLNGHMRMHGKSEGGYSVRRRLVSQRKNPNQPETYNCLHCGTENRWAHNIANKYCNTHCRVEYEYNNLYMPMILEGKMVDGNGSLRRYIFERDEHKCVKCGLGEEWNEEALRLQLDHIDGDSDNNFPDNLRVLCPNCHTQTPTWGSKGKGSRNIKYTKRNNAMRKLQGSLAQGESVSLTSKRS